MIRLRTASAITAGAVAALAIGGTALAAGSDTTASPAPAASESTPSAPSSAPSSAASADAISLDAAKAIAIKAAGGGQVTDIERETEHGRAVWDVEVQVGDVEHDMDVDRASGEVLGHQSERDTADDRDDDADDHDDNDDSDDNGSDD
ncbi:hypothetical protein DMB66_39910 [Actinoplanes sp. ATCC 53533]|uniref:PepSY domain-containing protein n=1 Tax=Actinoplanes sp. ATCC 53533 TaxID=1288362 RepID=UPI000F76CC38|nr:PepSY domain-containing protein [Actinoplanes sp. ATCC 53533]RSM52626.1 hypothetical protein DMB66_39910 [Actinoplanes sp. ATCC 53533]